MRFLADQDVFRITIDFIDALGHDVLRAAQVGLSRASDEEIIQRAHEQDRILITRDKGFGALVFVQVTKHSGVILLRITPQTLEATHQELQRLLSTHSEDVLKGCFVTVEPGRHRIRSARLE